LPFLQVVSIAASLWQRIALAWMTFAQLVTFALGHQQQEIDFLILEGSRGFQDVLKPTGNETLGIFWSQNNLTLSIHGTPVNLTINNPQMVKVVRRFNSNTNLPGKVVHLLETVCSVCWDLSEIEQM